MIRQKKYVEELLDRNQAMAKHMAEMEEVITESEKPRNTTDLSFLSSVQIGEPCDKGAEAPGQSGRSNLSLSHSHQGVRRALHQGGWRLRHGGIVVMWQSRCWSGSRYISQVLRCQWRSAN